MPDILSPAQRHTCMSHIRSVNTKPEVRLRKELFDLGYRYRNNKKGLPGSPDIVLSKYRTCIFVNGCFWHGHEGCKGFVMPKSNVDFWQSKIDRNRERDRCNYQTLADNGWQVVVIWECQIKSDLERIMLKVAIALNSNYLRIVQHNKH